MGDIKVCRICLIMGVKMYDLRAYPLLDYFEPIIGLNPLHMLDLPLYACFECAAIIKRFYMFRERCLQGQQALYNILHTKHQISSTDIEKLDRNALNLTSNLAIQSISVENTFNFIYDDIQNIKAEVPVLEDFSQHDSTYDLHVSEIIKEEIDDCFDDPGPFPSSDDDTPLSIHKKKKKTNKRKGKKAGKKKKKDVAPTEPLETLEGLLEKSEQTDEKVDDILIPPERPRRGRKKRTVEATEEPKVKKKRGPKKSEGLTPDEMDMEEYVTIVKLTPEEQRAEVEARRLSANFQNAPLKCSACFKGFVDNAAYAHHLAKHSDTSGDIECPICKFRFKTRRLLQKHASNHEKKYSCKSCPYVSKTTTQAKQHHKWHEGVTYKCQHCDEISTKWTSYLSHVRIKHPSQFVCGACGYSFVSQLGLTMHRTMMHKDTNWDAIDSGPYCEDCSVQFMSEEAYKRHMVTSAKHTKSNNFGTGCRACGATFASAEELRLHHRERHARRRPKNYGKKPHPSAWPARCPLEPCPEVIGDARALWAHYRRAHPAQVPAYPVEKAFVCEECGKRFRGNAFLLYHQRTHAELRAFACAECPKAFFNRTNLQMHLKTHSEARPHACALCAKAFKSKGALDRHARSHSGERPYACGWCAKRFGQSNSRKLHERTVHLKQPAPYLSRARLLRRAEPRADSRQLSVNSSHCANFPRTK